MKLINFGVRALRRATLLAALMAAVPGGAAAQAADEVEPPRVEFLPRFAFHLDAAHLSGDDERFVWDANYGGEIDLLDFRTGRGTFYANYQVVMGEQLRAFDPNQGSYILGGLVSVRVRGIEAALVFHHESRHLSDRPKVTPIDWNMLGGRLGGTYSLGGRASLESAADIRRVVKKSFVDYTWELDARLRATVPLVTHVALVGDVDVQRMWVDGSRNRGAQHGVRVEGGLRLEGRGAAVELFLAGERRFDPYPLSFGAAHWLLAGFRLVNR